MTIHILLGLYISILGILIYHKGTTNRVNHLFVFWAFIAVFFIQSLRSVNVGLDSFRYYQTFVLLNNGGTSRFEFLYYLINRFVGHFTSNPTYLFAVCSFISDCGICIFIIENLDEDESAFLPVFSWVVFSTYLNSMNTMRQSMAIAFTINIFTVLKKSREIKNVIIAILLLLAGIFFHIAAVVCILYFIPFIIKKVNKKTILLTAFASVLVLPMANILVNYVIRFIPTFSRYITSWRFIGTEGIGVYYIVVSAIRLILVIFVFQLNETKDTNKELYYLSFYMIISIGFILLKTQVGIANRIVYYFDPFAILFVPKVLKRVKINNLGKSIMYISYYCYGWICFLYMLMGGNQASRGCVPYTFFWQ